MALNARLLNLLVGLSVEQTGYQHAKRCVFLVARRTRRHLWVAKRQLSIDLTFSQLITTVDTGITPLSANGRGECRGTIARSDHRSDCWAGETSHLLGPTRAPSDPRKGSNVRSQILRNTSVYNQQPWPVLKEGEAQITALLSVIYCIHIVSNLVWKYQRCTYTVMSKAQTKPCENFS